jgi:hypothetical protein
MLGLYIFLYIVLIYSIYLTEIYIRLFMQVENDQRNE